LVVITAVAITMARLRMAADATRAALRLFWVRMRSTRRFGENMSKMWNPATSSTIDTPR
jgi:hypothetical protein